jgi:hypothetical protein
MIILYYNLDINVDKFVNDERYMEEEMKEESFKEHLKKFDEEENVEIEGHEFIGTKLNIKYKGVLSRKGNDDNVVIKNSITTTAKEIPTVVNNVIDDDDVIVVPVGEVPPEFFKDKSGRKYKLRKNLLSMGNIIIRWLNI